MVDLTPEYLAALESIKPRLNALEWAMAYSKVRISGNSEWSPFSITTPPYLYPFLKEIYFQIGHGGPEHIVMMKGRKVAATTLALNAILYNMDEYKVSALYGLPKERHLRDLVNGVFDPLIKNAPYIQNMFSDTDNQGLKVGSHGSLYFRGTQSEEGIEVLAVGCIIRDELDQMDPSNASRLLECMSGSMRKFLFDLGHPQYPDEGIHAEYQRSSRGDWYFTCPYCGTNQLLTWEGNVDIKNNKLICSHGGAEITKNDVWRGKYIHADPANPVKGYHVSQILSPTQSLESQIIMWKEAQGVPYKMRNFHNNVLGLPYATGAKKLTVADVHNLMTGPPMANYGNGGSVGIDVGAGLHYWIQEGNVLVRVGVASGWEDIKITIGSFNPSIVIIDAGPEFHGARNLASDLRENGINSWLCRRSGGMEGKRKIDEEEYTITVNLTEQFDKFYASLNNLKLPIDLPEEAIQHLCAPERVTKKMEDGMVKSVYHKGISHFADAGCYANEGIIGTSETGPEIITRIPIIKAPSVWRKFENRRL